MRHFKNFTKTTELTLVQQKLSENCSIQFIQMNQVLTGMCYRSYSSPIR